MKPVVLATSPLYRPTLERLEREFTVHRLWEAPDRAALLASLAPTCEAVAASHSLSAATMQALPKLKVVAVFGVGYDAVDVAHARQHGITITNTPGVLSDEMADFSVGLLIAVRRRLVAADRFVRAGRWLKGGFPLNDKVSGSKVGIVGLGRIGKVLAKRLTAFDCEIHYHGRHAQPDQTHRYWADLVAMAREVDNLFAILPGGETTRGVISRPVLEALGPKGVFVNVGRGSAADETALVELLVAGKLGGAGLDVFVDEPKVPEALFALDNVVLQPHQGSGTRATRTAMGNLMVDNLVAHFAGRPLLTPVT
jgi:lactate dehydrogenase-like 2-hydroxyacid dehydrogenase